MGWGEMESSQIVSKEEEEEDHHQLSFVRT
jgi:hypothetical protein